MRVVPRRPERDRPASAGVEQPRRVEDVGDFDSEGRQRRLALDDFSPQTDLGGLMIAGAHGLGAFKRVWARAVRECIDPLLDVPALRRIYDVEPPAHAIVCLAREARRPLVVFRAVRFDELLVGGIIDAEMIADACIYA